jgi:hypothetical protein
MVTTVLMMGTTGRVMQWDAMRSRCNKLTRMYTLYRYQLNAESLRLKEADDLAGSDEWTGWLRSGRGAKTMAAI